MNLRDENLIDELARGYVLGTLTGPARRRFETLMASRKDFRAAVGRWEEWLTPLAWSLPPEQPSELLWPRIARELHRDVAPARTITSASNRFWPSVAAVFAVASVILGTGWWQAMQQPPEVIRETVVERVIERVPETVAVAMLDGDEDGVRWLARIALASGELTISTLRPPPQTTESDYQLWALNDAGVPVSLGLLPKQGERRSDLDPAAREALKTTVTLAVSLEPQGGSPRDVPTGPVLYTAPLMGP